MKRGLSPPGGHTGLGAARLLRQPQGAFSPWSVLGTRDFSRCPADVTPQARRSDHSLCGVVRGAVEELAVSRPAELGAGLEFARLRRSAPCQLPQSVAVDRTHPGPAGIVRRQSRHVAALQHADEHRRGRWTGQSADRPVGGPSWRVPMAPPRWKGVGQPRRPHLIGGGPVRLRRPWGRSLGCDASRGPQAAVRRCSAGFRSAGHDAGVGCISRLWAPLGSRWRDRHPPVDEPRHHVGRAQH